MFRTPLTHVDKYGTHSAPQCNSTTVSARRSHHRGIYVVTAPSARHAGPAHRRAHRQRSAAAYLHITMGSNVDGEWGFVKRRYLRGLIISSLAL